MIETKLTYKEAGVDIAEGNAFVEDIKPIAQKTQREGVLKGLGGFGALFELPLHRYKRPILVSSTDGVGTKLKIASMLNKHDTIGIDLVAMCVNDIIVQGAEPLFFLDYFATSKLDRKLATEVMLGIGKGCQLANVALIGGETAEMPGLYQQSDYDLAGFAVGIVDKESIIDGQEITPGSQLLAIASSGPHSNGYSLIRKILNEKNADLSMTLGNKSLGEWLIEPTKIYIRSLLSLLSNVKVQAFAHITGGGILENLPRVLPAYTKAIVNTKSWEIPAIFEWIQTQGNLSQTEMFRTFNCGVGMIVCVDKHDVTQAIDLLQAEGEMVWRIGEIISSKELNPHVEINCK